MLFESLEHRGVTEKSGFLREQFFEQGFIFDIGLASGAQKVGAAGVTAFAQMFADPYLLEKSERAELVAGLRSCVAANPEVSELRVLLGMALCVNFEVPDAIEELRESVRLSPDSFIESIKSLPAIS